MDVGTIVSWLQMAIWIGAAIYYWVQLKRGEVNLPPIISSNKALRVAILIGVLVSGFSLYLNLTHDRRRSNEELEREWDAYNYERIFDRTFKNETVILDGRAFYNCYFENTTLIYNGTGPVAFNDVKAVPGTNKVISENAIAKATFQILLLTGGIRKEHLAVLPPTKP